VPSRGLGHAYGSVFICWIIYRLAEDKVQAENINGKRTPGVEKKSAENLKRRS
jgi:hypothetical protein